MRKTRTASFFRLLSVYRKISTRSKQSTLIFGPFGWNRTFTKIKAVIEGQEQVAESFKGLKNFDMAGVIPETATVPLHAGAVKYYLERGLEIPETLIPPEYK